MSHLFILLVTSFFQHPIASASWNPVTDESIGREGEMYMLDENHIYALGEFSTNGGRTWQYYSIPPNSGSGRAVEFIDEKVGYLGQLHDGTYGLLKTTDGKTFAPVLGMRDAKVCGISHIDNDFVIAVGPYYGGDASTQAKRISISNDGGTTWFHPDVRSLVAAATDVHCTDRTHCVVAGTNFSNIGALFYTENGGKNWKEVATGGIVGWKFHFLNQSLGFATLWPNGFAKTIDGGKSWTVKTFEERYGFEGVGFFDENFGFTSGHESSLVTHDGGNTWSRTDLIGAVDKFILMNGVMYAKANQLMRYKNDHSMHCPDFSSCQQEMKMNELESSLNSDGIHLTITLQGSSPVFLRFVGVDGKTIATHQAGWLKTGENDLKIKVPKQATTLLVLSDFKLWSVNLAHER